MSIEIKPTEGVFFRVTGPNEKEEELPTLEEIELEYTKAVLTATHGNRTRTAKILGIDRRTLYRRLAHFKLDIPSEYVPGENFAHLRKALLPAITAGGTDKPELTDTVMQSTFSTEC